MKKMLFFLLMITSISSNAKDYIVGSGSEFKLTDNNEKKVSLSIYVSESSFTKLGVEYFFSTGGFLGVEAWQQFHFAIQDKGLSLESGYIQSADMKKAEIMTKDFMNNNEKGVKIEDFIFTKDSEIEKYKIGTEIIEVPAGSMNATHYQKKRDNQTVDFWISDKAGVIGLVKLVSQGTGEQNYKIELESLIKNVKTKINPKEATPLTDKGRIFLGKKK